MVLFLLPTQSLGVFLQQPGREHLSRQMDFLLILLPFDFQCCILKASTDGEIFKKWKLV
ncbi:MAG: hypothetical protein K9K63_18325 [Desulfotignum sp.]|nr:hypothetical protein [Desulfotignum sp.]